jgi:hypothetical protein
MAVVNAIARHGQDVVMILAAWLMIDVACASHELRVTVIVASSLVSNSNMLPGTTVGPLPVVQHAPCLCVDQGCFKSTHLKKKQFAGKSEEFLPSAQFRRSQLACTCFEKSV